MDLSEKLLPISPDAPDAPINKNNSQDEPWTKINTRFAKRKKYYW